MEKLAAVRSLIRTNRRWGGLLPSLPACARVAVRPMAGGTLLSGQAASAAASWVAAIPACLCVDHVLLALPLRLLWHTRDEARVAIICGERFSLACTPDLMNTHDPA